MGYYILGFELFPVHVKCTLAGCRFVQVVVRLIVTRGAHFCAPRSLAKFVTVALIVNYSHSGPAGQEEKEGDTGQENSEAEGRDKEDA